MTFALSRFCPDWPRATARPIQSPGSTILHPVWRSSTHARIRIGNVLRAIEGLRLPDQARVLEAGSGFGYAIINLAQRHPTWDCTGIEIARQDVENGRRIAQAEGLTNLRFTEASLVTHSEPSNHYDLILSGDVLEHIVEHDQVVAHWYRWLKPGGYLVLHLPKQGGLAWRAFPMFKTYSVHDHVRDEYTEAEIRALLTQAGFAIERIDYTFGPPGELAFELNQLFWQHRPLRFFFALLTFPVALPLAYLDFLLPKREGNAFLVRAYKPRAFGG